MRFLADHDVYAVTVDWLRQQGHDVVTAKDLGMQQAADEDLLAKAKELDRLFLSREGLWCLSISLCGRVLWCDLSAGYADYYCRSS